MRLLTSTLPTVAAVIATWWLTGAAPAQSSLYKAAPAAAPSITAEVVTETRTVVASAGTLPETTVVARCRPDFIATGGSWDVVNQGAALPVAIRDVPVGSPVPSGWSTTVPGTTNPFAPNAQYTLRVYAICVRLEGVTASLPTDPVVAARTEREDDSRARTRRTELQRQQSERTNALGLDAYHTEGNVLAVWCERAAPEVIIGTRDGSQTVRLVGDAVKACEDVAVGDYLTAEGEKEHELLFFADDIAVERGQASR